MNLTYLKIVPKWRSSGMKLFDKIRILRKARGLSQEQLGYSLSRVNKDGISRQTVSDWENGKFEPKLENIRDLAEVFNVSFDALLDESVDLENEKVLEAVLNKKPYDKKEFEDDLYLEPKQEVKNKRMTSWRTAVLMAVSVLILYFGVNGLISVISILTQITKDTTGYQTSLFLNSLHCTVCLGLGGVSFAFGLISVLRGQEAKKVVSILLIIAASYLIVYGLYLGIRNISTYFQLAKRDKEEGWNDGFYERMIPSMFVQYIYDLLLNTALLLLVIFAHKKLGNNTERFRQVY